MFGNTGSGKTYTMQGDETQGGILNRSLDVLFNSVKTQRAKWFTFVCNSRRNTVDVRTVQEAKQMRRQHKEEHPEDAELMDVDRSDIDIANRRRSYDPTMIALDDEDRRYSIFVQYVEIYNNYCYDLLVPPPPEPEPEFDPTGGQKKRKVMRPSLEVCQDERGGRFVRDALWVEVHSPEEAFDLLSQGQAARATASTALNAESSRSHSIFTMRLVSNPINERGDDVLRKGCAPQVTEMSLVDLAGSERTSRTNSSGDRRKEAGAINKSLSVLKDCMKALRSSQGDIARQRRKPKFNESRLTKLFERFLTGDGLASMMVCASPAKADASETVHVFDFAKMASEVQVEAHIPERVDRGLPAGRGTEHRLRMKARRAAGLDHSIDGGDAEDEDLRPLSPYTSQTQLSPHHQAASRRTTIDSLHYDDHPAFDERMRRSMRALEAEENEFREYLEHVERNQSKLVSELEEAERELEDALTANEQLRQLCDTSVKTRQELEAENASLLADLSSEQRARAEAEADVSALSREVHQLQQALRDAERSLDNQQKQREREAFQLQSELKEKENLARAELNRVSQEKLDLRRAKNELLERMDKARKHIEKSKKPEAQAPARSEPTDDASEPEDEPEPQRHYPSERNKQSRPRIYNQRSESMVDLPDAVMQPNLGGHAKTVSKPEAKELRRHNQYLLNHQDSPGEHHVYKGTVTPSRSGKGVSVVLHGQETLTTNHRLHSTSPKRRMTPLRKIPQRK
eukprot:TRINITY_DN12573_c2_g12_i1.p1 TRINITY_DN12573_c2_g12~~TRINITY_DN12573_c2_g12_i1.p1  ORF type:complete len:745 (+),score=170.01 TRINITY_DN12573_c2_g12_i1:210-2444(+)